MRKIKAYWLRFWHCLYYGLTRIMCEDHRMQNAWIYDKIAHIGCTCGKVFYDRHFLDIHNEVHKTNLHATDIAVKDESHIDEMFPECSKCKSPLIATNIFTGQELCGNKKCENYNEQLIEKLVPSKPIVPPLISKN